MLRAQNLAYCIIADEQPKSLFGEYKFDPFVSNQWMIASTAKTMLITVIIVVINSSTAFDGNYVLLPHLVIKSSLPVCNLPIGWHGHSLP